MGRLWQWLFGVSPGDFAGADGWSLRATVPGGASMLLGLLVLLAAATWLVLRCYRRELAAPPAVRMGIGALRVAALLAVLAVALQPELVIRFRHVDNDAVAVLVDDTLSMRWRDRYGGDTQRAALAAAMGIGEQRLAGEDRPSRAEAARTVLARSGGLLDRLAGDHPVLLYRFGVTEANAPSYVEEIPAAGGSGRPALGDLRADGRHTDLARAVREALGRLEGRRLAAMIVVSDGRGTAGDRGRLGGAVQVAAQRSVPLYAVAVGDPVPPRNVAVSQLLGPREARAGSRLSFTALVTSRSMPKTTLEVKLWRSRSGGGDWEDTGARAEVTVGGERPGGAAEREAETFEIPLITEASGVGIGTYEARISPPRDDSNPADDAATATVRVTDEKMKVLLVAGGASWEFQYLRNWLLRGTEHYAVTGWQQNADSAFNQDASAGMKRAALPTTAQELAEYDVVVLCDPRHVPGSFDERLVELLDRFVSAQQGGLCYLAGDKFTARMLTRHGALEPLAALLPVVLADGPGLSASGDDRQAFALELTGEGQVHPALQLAADGRDSLAAWRRLDGVYRSQPAARLKPLATALAVRAGAAAVPQEQAEPFIAVQYYGRGRVLYAGFDGTWRWRALDDAEIYERLWSSVMEFLAAGRSEKDRIRVTTAGETFDAGSDVEVRVEARNRDLNPLEAKALSMEMRPLDGGQAAAFVARRERPGLFVGTVRADRVGAFDLDVKGDEKGRADWTADDVSTRRIRVQLPQAEFHRPEADWDSLRELAGDERRFVPLAEAGGLPARIPPGKVVTRRENGYPLWCTKFMLILFGALLLTEWTLRKMNRMT